MFLLFGFIFIVYPKKRALVSAFRVFVFCDKCQYFGYQSVIIYIEDFCRFTVEGNKDGSQSFSGRVRFKFDICVNIHPCDRVFTFLFVFFCCVYQRGIIFFFASGFSMI